MNSLNSYPTKQGLYDSRNEHDSCGVGFVANIDGRRSHQIIENGLEILRNLFHRGAVGADPKAGDGVGVLLQIADGFFRKVVSVELPAVGCYAVGMVFMGKSQPAQVAAKSIIEQAIVERGQTVLCWRKVPVDNADLGVSVLPTEPDIWQVIVGRGQVHGHEQGIEQQNPMSASLMFAFSIPCPMASKHGSSKSAARGLTSSLRPSRKIGISSAFEPTFLIRAKVASILGEEIFLEWSPCEAGCPEEADPA